MNDIQREAIAAWPQEWGEVEATSSGNSVRTQSSSGPWKILQKVEDCGWFACEEHLDGTVIHHDGYWPTAAEAVAVLRTRLRGPDLRIARALAVLESATFDHDAHQLLEMIASATAILRSGA